MRGASKPAGESLGVAGVVAKLCEVVRGSLGTERHSLLKLSSVSLVLGGCDNILTLWGGCEGLPVAVGRLWKGCEGFQWLWRGFGKAVRAVGRL